MEKDFLDIAKSRYTTKVYQAGKKISDTDVQKLKEILRLSPSSINSQPWRFTFVADEKLKADLAEVSYHNFHKIQNCSDLIVFSVMDNVADFEAHIKANLPESAVAYYEKNIQPKSETEIKAWMAHQVYLSLGFFLSACASMNIDSTPMEGIETSAYDKILSIDGYKTLFAVAIGYRASDDVNDPSVHPKSRLSLDHVIKTV